MPHRARLAVAAIAATIPMTVSESASAWQITTAATGRRLLTASDTARAQVELFGVNDLETTISDQFDPPAVNWRNKSP